MDQDMEIQTSKSSVRGVLWIHNHHPVRTQSAGVPSATVHEALGETIRGHHYLPSLLGCSVGGPDLRFTYLLLG